MSTTYKTTWIIEKDHSRRVVEHDVTSIPPEATKLQIKQALHMQAAKQVGVGRKTSPDLDHVTDMVHLAKRAALQEIKDRRLGRRQRQRLKDSFALSEQAHRRR